MKQRRRNRNGVNGELVEAVVPLGPCMQALGTDRQREFVRQLFVGDNNASAAAQRAGYRADSEHSLRQQAYRLSRDPKILAAVREEAHRHMSLSVAMASSVITEVAADPKAKHRDRLHAAERIMDQSGLTVRQQHDYNVRITDADMIREIRLFAQQLGLDARQLLGNAGVTTIEHEEPE